MALAAACEDADLCVGNTTSSFTPSGQPFPLRGPIGLPVSRVLPYEGRHRGVPLDQFNDPRHPTFRPRNFVLIADRRTIDFATTDFSTRGGFCPATERNCPPKKWPHQEMPDRRKMDALMLMTVYEGPPRPAIQPIFALEDAMCGAHPLLAQNRWPSLHQGKEITLCDSMRARAWKPTKKLVPHRGGDKILLRTSPKFNLNTPGFR